MTSTPHPGPQKGGVFEVLQVLLPPLVLWLLALLIVRPNGQFPLNDDWIYGGAVLQWMESGHYTGHPFSTAALIGQAAWGRLFCALFGFSFDALRWSTLVLWALGAVFTGLMALRIGATRWHSALAACLVIANPLALNLGYTFMTDVPFLAIMAIAGYAYLRALEDGQAKWLLMGSVAAAAGLLTRQFAVLMVIAFIFVLLPRWRHLFQRQNGWRALALLVPWCIAGIIVTQLPDNGAALGHVWMPAYLGETLALQVYGAPKFYAVSAVYLALFTLPLLGAAAWAWYRDPAACWQRRLLWTLPALVAVAMSATTLPRHRMPYLDNILNDLGLGPRTLTGAVKESATGSLLPAGSVWWLLSVVGILGGAWLLVALLTWIRDWMGGRAGEENFALRRRQQAFLGIWAVLSILALYHPWLPVRFDRYLLGALVPVLVLIARMAGPVRWPWRGIQAGVVVVLLSFCLAAQHDYMAWNRARWEGLHALMDKGIRPEAIDGGYEFNGWYTSHHYIEVVGSEAFRNSGTKGWWVVDNAYAIGWRERPGYRVLRELPCDTWLGADQRLLVLERE